MFLEVLVLSFVATASAGPVTESYKNQFCTDPRTMQKHAAYTEWADAYSCTRHRCQPGGRNLAIYTVGCKRVEAPESAIECEEVVEDTNMQFPFCCTRLRCLVVVRGEVWTRVLGQPWETLPAAPWSHMYKMKKPPPPNGTMIVKGGGRGPLYELADGAQGQKVLRASKKPADEPDCDKPAAVPDIVIALATEPERKDRKKSDSREFWDAGYTFFEATTLVLGDSNASVAGLGHKRRKTAAMNAITDDEGSDKETREVDFEDAVIVTEKTPEASEEKSALFGSVTRKSKAHHQVAWTEIPQKEWNEQDPPADTDNTLKETAQPQQLSEKPEDEGHPALQALVDAIGSRMRDIENVVQRMSEKVHQARAPGDDLDGDKRVQSDAELLPQHAGPAEHGADNVVKPKQPATDAEHYKRFSVRNRGSRYLRPAGGATEPPLRAEDAALGYFSDAANSVVRRASPPKEPAQYVAPVESRHKTHILSDSDEGRKHNKRSHRKGHKKHHGKDRRKKLRVSSMEVDKNVISLEDNSAIVTV